MGYGIEILDTGDKYAALAEEALLHLNQGANAGAFLVDEIPLSSLG